MYGYVYKIKNILTDEVIYVGQTSQDIQVRYKRHISGNSNIAHGNLSKEIASIGVENFCCFCICVCQTKEECYAQEEYWIRYYKSIGEAKFNDSIGYKKSERYLREYKSWCKGKTGCYSDEARAKMGRCMKGLKNPMYGYVSSQDKKKEHSNIMKKYYSEHPEKKNYGKHWYTNGIVNKFELTCPEGFYPGITRKEKGVV